MNTFINIFKEIWFLHQEMAPYLLFGFFIAGLLHLLLPQDKVARHLAHNKFSSALKASLLGIPLPLCSCGVIPVTAHLKKQGASKGAVLSFLISTPTTGVDSMLATYSLMGPLLAIARPIAALFNGLLTGILANIGSRRSDTSLKEPLPAQPPPAREALKKSGFSLNPQQFKKVLHYAFVELIEDVAKWLILGIVAGGIISYLIPHKLVEQYLSSPLTAYPLMLLIGIPMYVCATGSIPIAASLILKGLSPGAGFIFLFAGPATNTAALSFVGGKMGRKTLVLYLSTILFSSILFGALVDVIWHLSGKDIGLLGHHSDFMPFWLKFSSAIFLVLLLLRVYLPKFKKNRSMTGQGLVVTVSDMTCEHCKTTINEALISLEGTEKIHFDLPNRKVEVVGAAPKSRVISAIEQAGYHVHPDTPEK